MGTSVSNLSRNRIISHNVCPFDLVSTLTWFSDAHSARAMRGHYIDRVFRHDQA